MGAELSLRSNTVVLAEWSESATGQELFKAEARADAWRIVEAFGQEGRPFELTVDWSSGAGSGSTVQITVARATRFSVYACSLTVRATNLSSQRNRVTLTATDGFTPSANVWERRDACDGTTPVVLAIPPFASSFVLNLADRSKLPGAEISVFDGAGTLRAHYSGATQPGTGVPIGAASRIQVLTSEPTDLRGIFQLSF